MKFGISFWLDGGMREPVELVKRAEKAGFDSVWFPDHYFLRDTFAVQALAASETKKVTLGTAVTSPFLRHPTALASAVASIHDLSGGRALYGIGGGGHEFPSELHTDMKYAMSAVKEAVEIARSLWAGQSVTYSGKVFRVNHVKLHYRAPGQIPVYLATRSKKMLSLSGEIADGAITHGVTEPYTKFVVENIREGEKKAGREAGSVDICAFSAAVPTRDLYGMRDRLKPTIILMAGGDYGDDMIPLFNLKYEEVAPIRAAVRSGDFEKAATLILPKMIHSFMITGSTDECIGHIEKLGKWGITHLITSIPEPRKNDITGFIDEIGHDIVRYFNEK